MYIFNVTLHVLAAMIWLGGMFFFALVGAPTLRSLEDDALRARLFHDLGTAFRTVGWVCIAVLLVTGVGNLHFRGMWGMEIWSDSRFWGSPMGRSFFWKLVTVGVMLAVQLVHDFNVGPRAGRAKPGTPEALRLRRAAAWMGRVNGVAGLVLLYFAVRLARGG
ncbi:MAG: DUF4149 domain-containing protein [Gemmatimonadota bacterium]|nr:DUF4149 domain-containing protein [Gemmatimonadota bacterium]